MSALCEAGTIETMIEPTQGDLLSADAEALVNTVNCVGVMGKGIALQFKLRFPENFRLYEQACRAKKVEPGHMFVFENPAGVHPRFIINFPTKRHWKGKSKIEDIESGLLDLINVVKEKGIKSIAVPPLGCGNGGLQWRIVRPIIEEAFEAVPEVRVLLFEPTGEPSARAVKVNTKRPEMNRARAMFVRLIDDYPSKEDGLTSIVAQKLAYFLQEGGEPMRLKYVAYHYGPYADNLNHFLQRLEGHFFRGCGVRGSSKMDLEVLPEAVADARAYLEAHPDGLDRLARVKRLIDGFESPYGLELLATVHWVTIADPAAADEVSLAISGVQKWSPRKNKLFSERHITKAWEHLRKLGWLKHANA